MKKSIIVVTKNSPDLLLKCINSIFKWIHPPYELIIVDNSNLPDPKQDEAIQVIEKTIIQNVMIDIVRNGKNLGSSKARNIGIEHAVGEFITFMDDDASIGAFYNNEMDLIDYFISIIRSGMRVAAVGPCIGITPRLNFTAITTATMTIPSSIKHCGFRFDERMGHNFDKEVPTCGYEDIDFSYQLYKSGYTLIPVGYGPGQEIPFFHPAPSAHENWEQRKKWADENTAKIFNEKWKADLDYYVQLAATEQNKEISKQLEKLASQHPNTTMFDQPKNPKMIYPFTDAQCQIFLSNELKLNLGSGDRYIEGNNWCNVDLFAKKADLRCNVTKLEGIKDNSVSLILATHIIEHFRVEEIQYVLNEWRRVLKPGGWLILEFPDCLKCFDWFIKHQTLIQERLNSTPQILGSPYMPGHAHYALLDFNFMKFISESYGFKNVTENLETPIWNIRHFVTRIDCQK